MLSDCPYSPTHRHRVLTYTINQNSLVSTWWRITYIGLCCAHSSLCPAIEKPEEEPARAFLWKVRLLIKKEVLFNTMVLKFIDELKHKQKIQIDEMWLEGEELHAAMGSKRLVIEFPSVLEAGVCFCELRFDRYSNISDRTYKIKKGL